MMIYNGDDVVNDDAYNGDVTNNDDAYNCGKLWWWFTQWWCYDIYNGDDRQWSCKH